MLKNFAPVASDGSYIYLRDANGLARWAPPADPEAEIPVAANLLVGGIAAQGDFIYLSAQDVTMGAAANGMIVRIPVTGGSSAPLVANIGHPANLVSDSEALYWTEDDPQSAAMPERVERWAFNSRGGPTTLVPATIVRSLATSNGQLYLSTGTSIETMSSSGGALKTLATGLTYPGLLAASGNEVVWVDPFQQALSGTAPVNLDGTCVTAQH